MAVAVAVAVGPRCEACPGDEATVGPAVEVAVVHHEQLGRQFEVDRVLPRAAAPLHHPLPMVPHLRVGNATSATSAWSQVRSVPPMGAGRLSGLR